MISVGTVHHVKKRYPGNLDTAPCHRAMYRRKCPESVRIWTRIKKSEQNRLLDVYISKSADVMNTINTIETTMSKYLNQLSFNTLVALTLAWGTALCTLAVIAWSPFVALTLADVGMTNAGPQAAAIALLVVAVGAAAKVAKLNGKIVLLAFGLLTVGVIGGRYVATKHHAADAAKSAYELAVSARKAAIADQAKCIADIDSTIAAKLAAYKGAYITATTNRLNSQGDLDKAACRANLTIPAVPTLTKASLTTDDYIEIAGLATLELAIALLVELAAASLGLCIGFVLAGLVRTANRRTKTDKTAKTEAESDFAKRSAAAKKGWETRRANAAKAAESQAKPAKTKPAPKKVQRRKRRKAKRTVNVAA